MDHQASTPMHPGAAEALSAAVTSHYANPHANDHALGLRAAEAVDKARLDVASSVGADPNEIVFTSGATEANNLALLGLTHQRPERGRVIVSSIEHKAVLGPARELERRGLEFAVAPVTDEGVVNLEALNSLITDETLLVSIMLVNNEIGTVQPICEVAKACARVGATLHIDAAQALSWMSIDASQLGADMLSVSAHKMGGPKGVGALFIRSDLRPLMRPIFHGGEQEEGLRPGTLPTPLCVAFGAACRNSPSAREVAEWRDKTRRLEGALLALWPGAWINGVRQDRHPGSISLTMPNVDADRLLTRLQASVAVSRGSACTSGTPEPSHVLRAIGLTAEQCEATLRVSPGRYTTDSEIEAAIDAFASAMADA